MATPIMNPIADLLNEKPALVLDGALATELETRGMDLSSALWSAKALEETPEMIYQVHLDYFRAGADVAITASYQATPLGLKEHMGLDLHESQRLIRRSVELAQRARLTALVEEQKSQPTKKPRKLLVAGSVGPYGAYLANGSEYHGDYFLSEEAMKDFHRPRIEALVDARVDVLAFETMPAIREIRSLIELLEDEFPAVTAWISCTLHDSTHLSDGAAMIEVAKLVNASKQIVAFGVNCIPEQDVIPSLTYLKTLTEKPLVAYPNSGEQWNAEARYWSGQRAQDQTLAQAVSKWRENGARLIGGCCRTGPKDIKLISDTLLQD
ncbi:hypothetical protein MBLNU459_g5706t1 [Dothideomycetes sp. NU459]